MGYRFPFRDKADELATIRNHTDLEGWLDRYGIFRNDDGLIVLTEDTDYFTGFGYKTAADGNGQLGYSDGSNYLTHDATFETRFRSWTGSVYNTIAEVDDDGILLASGKAIRGDGVGARMYRVTSDQSITGGAGDTVIDWNAETFDTSPDSDMVDLANNRFTVPFDGLYYVSCGVSWAGTAPNQADLRLRVNGTVREYLRRNYEPNTYSGVQGSTIVNLSATNTVSFTIAYGTTSVVRAHSTGVYSWATIAKIV